MSSIEAGTRRRRGLGWTIALALAVMASPAARAGDGKASIDGDDAVPLRGDCAALAPTLSFADAHFVSSALVAAGTLSYGGKPVAAHCVVSGRMFERIGPIDGKAYAIGFEMRLPLAWNGRYFYQANGGIDGNVVIAAGATSGGGPLTSALLQGFAVISSDAGHDAAQNPTFGVDPQARLDYGYEAVGKLTPMAKAVILQAYGVRPRHSYFGGCSNGGRHAMVAAARYADEYDGFLAGSAGFNLPKAAVRSIYRGQQYAPLAVPGAKIVGGPFAGLPDLSGAWTPAERQLVSDRVLARCDALDGVVDGQVQDLEACQRAFDLDRDVPTCAGPRDGTCLSADQKSALGRIFAGPVDAAGHPIYARFPFDSGHGSSNTIFWEFIAPVVLDPGAVGFVFKTPPADAATFVPPLFSLGSDVKLLAQQIRATDSIYTQSGMQFMTPPDPENLGVLRRRGGKLIVYHGISDPIFSVLDTVRWYRALGQDAEDRDREHEHEDEHDGAAAADYARLFLVPGMNHCSGGPATDQFDMLSTLVRWVEHGEAPARVIAQARGAGNPGGANAEVPANWAPDRTRPLCPYPQKAIYAGGPADRAESFACR